MWKRRLFALLILLAAPLTIAGDCEFEVDDDCEVFCD